MAEGNSVKKSTIKEENKSSLARIFPLRLSFQNMVQQAMENNWDEPHT